MLLPSGSVSANVVWGQLFPLEIGGCWLFKQNGCVFVCPSCSMAGGIVIFCLSRQNSSWRLSCPHSKLEPSPLRSLSPWLKEQYPVTAHASNFDFWTVFWEIKRCEESKRTLRNPFASRLAKFNTALKLLRITNQ